jgi:hypothetical protein
MKRAGHSGSEVEAWFAALQHPLESLMRRVREIILGADPRMSELIQYGTLQFAYKSGLCSLVQVKDKKKVTLMFNAAGRLAGTFPHLEGRSVKYMYFADLAEVHARADELTAIVAAWIAHKDGATR